MVQSRAEQSRAEQSRAEQSRAEQRYEWIATLRGIAALLVFISHLSLPLPHYILFMTGRVGVVLFLLMTGYLAVGSRKKRTTGQYLFNRFIRMYPIFWFLVIISFFIDRENYTMIQLATNLTIFSQFLGQHLIIGSSWMMPMQIVFFVIVAFLSDKMLCRALNGEYGFARNFLFGFGALSLILSVLRFYTGKPFPVAFALLIMIAVLGTVYRYQKSDALKLRLLGIFEIILIPSVLLSYPGMVSSYIIAYNIGILLFVWADRTHMDISVFKNLGVISFTFFLGGNISHGILRLIFGTPTGGTYGLALSWMELLVIDVVVSILVTKWIEQPLHRWSIAQEKKLFR